MVGEDGDHHTAGLLITAMRVLRAIPKVCQAAPGMLGANDVGLHSFGSQTRWRRA